MSEDWSACGWVSIEIWIFAAVIVEYRCQQVASICDHKSGMQWIFSLKLAGPKKPYTDNKFAILQSNIERAQNSVLVTCM